MVASIHQHDSFGFAENHGLSLYSGTENNIAMKMVIHKENYTTKTYISHYSKQISEQFIKNNTLPLPHHIAIVNKNSYTLKPFLVMTDKVNVTRLGKPWNTCNESSTFEGLYGVKYTKEVLIF